MKKLTMILMLLSAFGLWAFNGNQEYYFRAEWKDIQELELLKEQVSIDRVQGNWVYAYANEHEWACFAKLGLRYQILPHPGLNPQASMAANPLQMRSWDYYPTYDAYINMMYDFAAQYPQNCRIVDAGITTGGRQILFAVLGQNVHSRLPKPRLMYTSTMHGDETVGFVLMLRLIDSFLNGYGSDSRLTNLMDNAEIWINPNANPDATYYAGNHTVNGSRRYNNNGYDLNRNFPGPSGSQYSGQPRQIETQIMMDIGLAEGFNLVANFHGGAEVVNYPWDHKSALHVDDNWYQVLSRAYATSAQNNSPAGYMTYLNNGITNGADWYITTGNRQDWTNFAAGGRETTIEISNTKNPAASSLPNYWNYNYDALLGYLEAGLKGIWGQVKDAYGHPLAAQITVLNHDDALTTVNTHSDTGAFFRYLSPGNYDLKVSTAGYDDIILEALPVYANQATPVEIVFGEAIFSQVLEFEAGWNQFCYSVLDENFDLAALPGLLQIKDLFESYNPTLPEVFNTLNALQPGRPYWVKLAQPLVLQLNGLALAPEAIRLKKGWNFVAYTPLEEMNTQAALAGVWQYVEELSLPEASSTLRPNQAFWLKLSEPCLLEYP